MRSRAIKFISRAPRYTLSPNDNRFLRYAREAKSGQSYTTRFLDISQTGLAFIADRESAPQLSDLIKIEIPLSDTETVAWWGRVVRIEEYAPHKWYMRSSDFDSTDQVLVGIAFHELPEGHSRLIRRTLEEKFAEQRRVERKQRVRHFATFAISQGWKLTFYLLATLATIWFLHYLSRPTLNYDAEKGAPWGERFPWLQIKPDKKPPLAE